MNRVRGPDAHRVLNEFVVETGTKSAPTGSSRCRPKRFYIQTVRATTRSACSSVTSTATRLVRTTVTQYDREERTVGRRDPLAAAAHATDAICWEANVITLASHERVRVEERRQHPDRFQKYAGCLTFPLVTTSARSASPAGRRCLDIFNSATGVTTSPQRRRSPPAGDRLRGDLVNNGNLTTLRA